MKQPDSDWCRDWCGGEVLPPAAKWPAVFRLRLDGHRRRYFCSDFCRQKYINAQAAQKAPA